MHCVFLGCALGCYSPHVSPSCCEISWDGSFVVMCLPGVDQLIRLTPQNNDQRQKTQNQASEATVVYGDASRKGMCFDVAHK